MRSTIIFGQNSAERLARRRATFELQSIATVAFSSRSLFFLTTLKSIFFSPAVYGAPLIVSVAQTSCRQSRRFVCDLHYRSHFRHVRTPTRPNQSSAVHDVSVKLIIVHQARIDCMPACASILMDSRNGPIATISSK